MKSLIVLHVLKSVHAPQFTTPFSTAHLRISHCEQWPIFAPLPVHDVQLIISAVKLKLCAFVHSAAVRSLSF
jgi:hypothetical protein